MFFLIMHATVAVRHIFLAYTGSDSDNRDQVATLDADLRDFPCRLRDFVIAGGICPITESMCDLSHRQIMLPSRQTQGCLGLALALAFEGVGSVAYHGPGGKLSKAVHDIGILGLLAAFAAVLRDDRRALQPTPVAATLGASAAALHVLSRTGGPLCSCNSKVHGHAIFHVLAAAATVAAAKRR